MTNLALLLSGQMQLCLNASVAENTAVEAFILVLRCHTTAFYLNVCQRRL